MKSNPRTLENNAGSDAQALCLTWILKSLWIKESAKYAHVNEMKKISFKFAFFKGLVGIYGPTATNNLPQTFENT